MLEEAHETNISTTRVLDLRKLLVFYERHADKHEGESIDWGYGDSFRGERRFKESSWNPVEGSEVRN